MTAPFDPSTDYFLAAVPAPRTQPATPPPPGAASLCEVVARLCQGVAG